MLKVKKIMESVIPQSYELSEGEKTAFKEMCNDGAMYYESTCNADRMYCLLCGTVSEVGTEGKIQCPRCGNQVVRQRSYNDQRRCIRTCEIIDDFVVIKESNAIYNEKMDGPEVFSHPVSCIVIQGNDIGYFESRNIAGYYDARGPRRWSRIRKPSQYYRYNQKDIIVRVLDEAIYDMPLFQQISNDLYKERLASIYFTLAQAANGVEEAELVCPDFDDSIVSYDDEKAQKHHKVVVMTEHTGNAGMSRVHYWCSQCGHYHQKIDSSRYGYGQTRNICPHCNDYNSEKDCKNKSRNYYIFPQEQEDGTLLMRVDEVYFNAEFTTKNEIGVDPLFKFDFELARIFYIHVLLTGKAVFFNEDGEPIDKTGIPNEPGRRIIQQHYIISAYHKSIIMNNKAMKRTGFIEYSQKSNCMDLRYFDALGKVQALEMLSKVGMTTLVTDLLYAEDKDIPGYMKKDDGKNGIKKLTKPQMQELIASNCNLSKFVSYMQVIKKDPEATYEDFNWVVQRSHSRHILDILRVKVPNMTVKKIRDYLEHVDEAQCCPVNESAQLWSDYVRMLRDLDCDLTDKSLVYPNSLKREHDKAARKMTQVKDEKLNAVFRERAQKNEKYIWENEEFKVIIPHDISELYEEGRKLSHCVGTYGKTVAEGRSVIAFIRKQSEVDTPLCTIEIRQGAIVQARGMSNRPAENIPKMKGFINAWAKNKGLIYAA